MRKPTGGFPIRQGLLKIRRRSIFKNDNLFEIVKLNITTRQAAEAYDFQPNRSSMICCPFHTDRNPIFFSSMTNPATRFVNNIVYAGVGLVGAIYAVAGGITIGQLSIFLSYANQYTKPFNEISGVVAELQSAMASARRVFEVIDFEEQTPDAETPRSFRTRGAT